MIAGGGLGGATLGRALAMHGARVLIVERELAFRDRVRGEGMLPWGVAEARALGVDSLLRDGGAREIRWWKRYLNAVRRDTRDLIASTPTSNGCFDSIGKRNRYSPYSEYLRESPRTLCAGYFARFSSIFSSTA